MSISKLLTQNNESNIKNSGVQECQYGNMSCRYKNTAGNCMAEWCIYSQLPKIIASEKEVTCIICEENKSKVSVYSNQVYICPSCKNKLKKLMESVEDE